MSFQTNYQPPKYHQPQNNLSSPNLYGGFRKSELNIQFEKGPQVQIGTNQYSQRQSANIMYGQVPSEQYSAGSARQMNGDHKGKINEMSSDLAKLKEQLSKIMSQAGTLEKRPVSTNQTNWVKASQEVGSQSFNKLRYTEELSGSSVNTQINRSQERSSLQSLGGSPQSFHHRVSENSRLLPMQLPSVSTRPLLTSPNYAQQKQQKKMHSESEKAFNTSVSNVSKYASYSTSQELSSLNEQFGSSKNPEINNNGNGYYFGKNYDIKIDAKPVLKVRDEESKVNVVNKNIVQKDVTATFNNEYVSPQISETPKPQQKPLQQPTPTPNTIPQPIPKSQPIVFSSPISLAKQPSPAISSHQQIVSKIVSQQLSKKLQQSNQIQQLKKKRQQEEYQYQERIIELEHEKRRLKHELSSVVVEKENLEVALGTERAQREAVNRKYQELEEVFKGVKFQLEEAKTRYKLLEKKLESELSRTKVVTEPMSFDEALKQQIDEIAKLKQQVQDKDEQIMRVKEINTSHRRQIQSLHNQIKIEQLKAASQVNECQQKHSILVQDKENEIKTMKNLVVTLEAKLDCAIKENKTKDAFMVQHLTGKAKLGEEKEYIENFFKHYEVEFPTNRIADKLKEELTEIERLKKTILEMAGSKV